MRLPKLFHSVRASKRAYHTCRHSFSTSSARCEKTPTDPKTPTSNKDHVVWRTNQLKSANIPLYPHKFEVSDKISEVVRDYSGSLGKGERAIAASVSIAGRINGVREVSKKLHFIDLKSGDGNIQASLQTAGLSWVSGSSRL